MKTITKIIIFLIVFIILGLLAIADIGMYRNIRNRGIDMVEPEMSIENIKDYFLNTPEIPKDKEEIEDNTLRYCYYKDGLYYSWEWGDKETKIDKDRPSFGDICEDLSN